MLRAMRRERQQLTIQQFLHKAQPKKRAVAVPALPPPPKIGDLTPERAAKEEPQAVALVQAPPFNAHILGVVNRYAQQLGQETVMVLERLYELYAKGGGSRGLTAGYDGIKVDVSRTSYDHLTAAEAEAHNALQRAMRTMPKELRHYAAELVLEDRPPGRWRGTGAVAEEVTSYRDRGAHPGAIVALLKVIAWCVQTELSMGGRRGTKPRGDDHSERGGT